MESLGGGGEGGGGGEDEKAALGKGRAEETAGEPAAGEEEKGPE